MAGRRKVGAVTVAALAALVVGVEISSAGILDPPPLVSPPPLVEEAVSEVDDVVTDATQTVDQAAGQATRAVDQVTETAGKTTKAVDEIVNTTPVGKVLDEVGHVVAPVVTHPVQPLATKPSSAEPLASSAGSLARQEALAAASSEGRHEATPATPAVPLTLVAASAGDFGSGMTVVWSTRQFDEPSVGAAAAPPLHVSIASSSAATGEPVLTVSRADESSSLPWPLSPGFPIDTAAVAALVAGAAGAAPIVALLAAFMLMAPSAGRWLRPGPILARPDTHLSLAERPG